MTLNTSLMFSSDTDKWDTPADLVEDLATVFGWSLDVCASRPNVCAWFNSEADPHKYPWAGRLCWMNPPYGRKIGKWVDRARSEARQPGTAVVCLLPSRTDTKWWHRNIEFATQVVFIRGRLKFGDATNSAPFPSAFVVFGEITDVQRAKLASYGWSVDSERQQLETERELTHEYAVKLALCQEELEQYKAAALLNDTAVAAELEGHGLDVVGVG